MKVTRRDLRPFREAVLFEIPIGEPSSQSIDKLLKDVREYRDAHFRFGGTQSVIRADMERNVYFVIVWD